MATRKKVLVSADASEQLLLTTGGSEKGFSLLIPTTNSDGNTNTLGGGTLTLLIRQRENSADNAVLLDTPVVTESSTYDIGGDVEVYYTLAGATTPIVEMHLATYS